MMKFFGRKKGKDVGTPQSPTMAGRPDQTEPATPKSPHKMERSASSTSSKPPKVTLAGRNPVGKQLTAHINFGVMFRSFRFHTFLYHSQTLKRVIHTAAKTKLRGLETIAIYKEH
jgi:hypothetical protein